MALIGLLLLIAAAVGVYFGRQLLEEDDGFALEAGEVFLQPASEVGPDPYSPVPLAPPPDPTLASAPIPLGDDVPIPTGTALQSLSPTEPGLYGGTNDNTRCDAEQLKAFLATNPDKAAAWVAALNTDPQLGWSGGVLTVADIPAYVDELEPLVLVHDTRVTNHGFRNGEARPLQSLLQKGTAVLVDKNGFPRVRCYCGNPLIAPKPGGTTYTGPQTWPGGPGTPNPTPPKVPTPAPGPLDEIPLCRTEPGGDDGDGFCAVVATEQPDTDPVEEPVLEPEIEIAVSEDDGDGGRIYSVQLRGYPPNSMVTLTCESSAVGFHTETVTVDANGEYSNPTICGGAENSVSIVDDQGNASTVLIFRPPDDPSAPVLVLESATPGGQACPDGRVDTVVTFSYTDADGDADRPSGARVRTQGGGQLGGSSFLSEVGDGSAGTLIVRACIAGSILQLEDSAGNMSNPLTWSLDDPPPEEPVGEPAPVVSNECSPTDAAPDAQMTAINLTGEPIQIVWHDFNCQATEPFAILGPDDQLPGQPTFMGHVWSAARLDGTIIETFTVPDAGPIEWRVLP